ncbi:6-aminohexanoate-dimer hydrolase [Teratosphaeria nubilosa]|uniref:6-aminohexanoate-dimer hydrolase n=1 Tax=Teratosphaeria nubilosa TaxID=161662 RepID=A0A6G1L9K8_9PEZI|nr:6-aminohexanoate-dimer hydrolase [Teratosphaeria nubilosa]
MTALSNWRQHLHNEWCFHNIDKILNVHTVKKSINKTQPFQREIRAFDDFKIQTGENTFTRDQFQQATHIDGLIVLHKGKLVYEFYDHGNDENSKHILMSMTKSVTGLITGIPASQGKLRVTDLVKAHVPEASPAYENVTVQQLLDMTSGMKFEDTTPAYRAAAGWTPPPQGETHPDNLHDFLSSFQPEIVKPDPGFIYASANTDLLGWVLERASGGKNLAALISEHLWQPMGAESDAALAVDKNGNARAAGGLCATLRDVARIGRLIASGGDGVIPASWVDDTLHNGDLQAFAKGRWAPGFQGVYNTPAYRNCMVTDRETEMCMGIGIHGQQLIIDRANDIVLAKTASSPNPSDFGAVRMTGHAFREFRRILMA